MLEAALVGGFVLVGLAGYLVGGAAQAVTAISLFALAGFRMTPSIQRFQAITTQVINNLPHAEAVIADIAESTKLAREVLASDEETLAEHPEALSLDDVGTGFEQCRR